MKQKDEEWALFWCSLLHPIIFDEIGPAEVHRCLKELAAVEHRFPDGSRRRPSLSTLRRKLRQYGQHRFAGLARKLRTDRGCPRAHSKELIARAIALKRDQPFRSDEAINQFLQVEFGRTIPKSTLYRYLKKAGATRLKLGVTKKKVRIRWTKDHTHDLWVGDFEEGPYVMHAGEVAQTHLCAWIDCHSRFIPEARYYIRQNLDILIDSLLRAMATHGKPLALYTDNAKVYHAKALKAACYDLHTRLIYRTKGDPSPGGVIEKFFQTVQTQFEAEVKAGEILALERLNRAFSAWLEVSYHRRVHAEIKVSPWEKYEQGLTVIRRVDMAKAITFFMQREIRRVHKDFSDVRLASRFYRVDKRFRGDRVEVRFDPYSTMDCVLIYSLDEIYLGQGIQHQREKGEATGPITPARKPQYNYLELLIQEHEKELQAKAKGIDYRQIRNRREWSFASFAAALAQLLGKKGGLTAFTTGQLEFLKNFYNRTPTLTASLLEEAVAQADEKTLPAIAYQLQILTTRKEN